MDGMKVEVEADLTASAQPSPGRYAIAPAPRAEAAPLHGPRVPLPGPNDDVRAPMGLTETERRYMQGDALPATSSVLISNSKYLNNPYYREAFASQALRRHGPDLPATYMVPYMAKAMAETTDHARLVELLAEERVKRPEFGAWLDARRYSVFTRAGTAHHKPGTLGATIHAFLNIEGMDMEFATRTNEGRTDAEYLRKRSGSLHDIEHMITGFGPNTAGENALAMANVVAAARYFTPELAQMMTTGAVWITATGYNRTALHYHHALPAYLDAMQQGIRVALALKIPVFMVVWEDFDDCPLDENAAQNGFERGPGDAWDWTTEATTG